ncbi:hypothetical protein R5R35_012671 [Gryllus longicercus]|uniref:Modular serine protease n=1 Tax=Gryllus longicercus TaxID=2509291 RepID=A0AAN9VP81_9ORTH
MLCTSAGKFCSSLLLFGVTIIFVKVFIHYSEEASFDIQRRKRQSCSANEFQCYSGQCVDRFVRCDGLVDCEDGTDETYRTCQSLPCPPYAYKCEYGACANADAKCNKIKDCADGSDEMGCPLPPSIICKRNQYECKSDICIDNLLRCDGTTDCDDGSDETKDACGSIMCPSYSFQCDYGACIDKDGLCNGIKQCADGSDETTERCGMNTTTPKPTTQPTPSSSCKLPSQPENGQYKLGGCNLPCQHNPGQIVNNAYLIYTCDPGFVLSGSPAVYCDGGWSAAFPTCSQTTCSELNFPSREIECILNNQNVKCDQPMAPGTKAFVKCNAFYINYKELDDFVTTCQSNGTWSHQVLPCNPKCGEPNPNGVPFVAGSSEARNGEFPCHVGIYRLLEGRYQQVCGGNIITERIIITAAHCFWDTPSQVQIDSREYRIAAGKFYREWNHSNDTRVQTLEIDNVVLHHMFRGTARNWADDIAVVKLKNSIVMRVGVAPICVDYNEKFENLFSPGKSGIVMGWGYTENQTQSDTLRKATLPFVAFEICEKKVPPSFVPILTSDKFCAGYDNGTSVCGGDSGGGFATKFRDGKYYLMGLVSIGVTSTENCNIFQYTTFTRVSKFYSFIKKNIS